MKTKVIAFGFVAALLTGIFSTGTANPTSLTAFANTELKFGGNGYSCTGNDANRWKTETTASADLGNKTIASVFVKAGQSCVEVFPTNNASSCYKATITGNSIVVSKIGTGSSCKDISHLEGTYATALPTATPTPTCTPTPTVEVTPTPTDVVTPTPTVEVTPTTTQEASPSATPTPTVDVTATPTPTTTSTNSGSTQGTSSSSTPQVQSVSAVLGTSTMAATGTFIPQVMNSLLSLGVISLSIGSLLYAKTKKA